MHNLCKLHDNEFLIVFLTKN